MSNKLVWVDAEVARLSHPNQFRYAVGVVSTSLRNVGTLQSVAETQKENIIL